MKLELLYYLFFFGASCLPHQVKAQEEKAARPKPATAVPGQVQKDGPDTMPQTESRAAQGQLPPFRQAVHRAIPAVVLVRSIFVVAKGESAFSLQEPFGNEPDRGGKNRAPDQINASGVLISSDGYVVTTNHVVEKADSLEVTLWDQRLFPAHLVGQDSTTDLALLKIEEKNLPFLTFADSDSVETGDWVLAIGSPFNLAATVTAGIVSAKARSLGRLQVRGSIESYIQTDAAVNKGNSGGPLVDLQGRLVGINAAFATPTGAYAGYSFAIPAALVKKVASDLQRYGKVIRPYLGVYLRNMDGREARKMAASVSRGALVDSLVGNSPALAAGILPQDVIVRFNDIPVPSAAFLRELLARHAPGDQITLTLVRAGKERLLPVGLKAYPPLSRNLQQENQRLLQSLGITVKELSPDQKTEWNLKGGLAITDIKRGSIEQETEIQKGFVILQVNRKPVLSAEDFFRILSGYKGATLLEGIYLDDPFTYHVYGLWLETEKQQADFN